MSPKQGSLVLMSCLVIAAAVSSASAVPPPPHEYGLRGLRRVEIVFVNPGRGGLTSGVVATDFVVSPAPPTDDLASHAFAKDQECLQIRTALPRFGLEVVVPCVARPGHLVCLDLVG